eukprot:CCRYP_011205-RB/>CCRYP_011205-RB protein AED:0.42 eAED:0.43 QI:0/0/0/1/0/0/2/0/199
MFRVRPVLQGESGGDEDNLEVSVSEGGSTIPYSSPSLVIGRRKSRSGNSSGGGTSNEFLKLFQGLPSDNLLAKGGISKVPLSEAFANVDLVFLYASAHWCGPCRKYTPQLIKFYNDVTKSIEIVFVSTDHDISSFKSYYASMPWLAVPFDCSLREKLLSFIKCTGIPRLVCMDGKTGKILEANAVGRALDLGRFGKYLK